MTNVPGDGETLSVGKRGCTLRSSLCCLCNLSVNLKLFWDFPGGPVAKTPSSQCRGPRFQQLKEAIHLKKPNYSKIKGLF